MAYVRVLRDQSFDRIDRDVDDAPSWDGVEDDWLVGFFSDRREVLEYAFLGGLVVVAGDVEYPVGPRLVGVPRHGNGLARRIRTGACDYGYAAIGGGDYPFHDFGMLFVVQSRGFAGRSHGKKGLDSSFDLTLHEFLQILNG